MENILSFLLILCLIFQPTFDLGPGNRATGTYFRQMRLSNCYCCWSCSCRKCNEVQQKPKRCHIKIVGRFSFGLSWGHKEALQATTNCQLSCCNSQVLIRSEVKHYWARLTLLERNQGAARIGSTLQMDGIKWQIKVWMVTRLQEAKDCDFCWNKMMKEVQPSARWKQDLLEQSLKHTYTASNSWSRSRLFLSHMELFVFSFFLYLYFSVVCP